MYGRTHTHAHTVPYMYFTATIEEMLCRVPILQPSAAGGERGDIPVRLRFETVSNDYQHDLFNRKITPTKTS